MQFTILSSVISAILMALSFPPYSAWGLSFVALVPFLIALFKSIERKEPLKKSVTISYAMAIAIVFTGFYWVSYVATAFGGLPWIVGKVVLVAFSLFGEAQFLLFGIAVYFLLQKRYSKRVDDLILLVGVPILYTGIDFYFPKIFPNTLGHGLYGFFSLAQIAEYTGVPALTFLMLATNAAIAVYFTYPEKRKSALVSLSFFTILIFAGALWGNARVSKLQADATTYQKKIRLSLVQANIGDIEKLASEAGSTAAVDKVLNVYRGLSIESKKRFHPDLIVWPETAYPLLYTHFMNERANRSGAARDQFISDLVDELNTPLAFGGYHQEGRREYNSIFLVRPKKQLDGIYHKNILLAFGEYVPLGPFAPLVMSIIPTIADFGRGQGPMLMQAGEIKFSPQICYEGIIPDFTREGVKLGADFILNVTNDSWFGNTSEPWIHFWITAFRSIELRTPMVRSTNTGFTAVVDHTGKVVSRTTLFQPEVYEYELKLPNTPETTFYKSHGEVFAYIVSILALALICLSVFNVIRKKKH